MIRSKTPTGWANLCEPHYEEFHARQATANLARWGMERLPGESHADHVERMRKFVRSGFKGFSSRTMAYAAKSKAA